MSFTERVHAFGDDGALVGVVTLPAGAHRTTTEARPFVVLLNAGLVHRVGPFGMGVQLARALAGRGFRVLRFDQAGLGDSGARPGVLPIEAQVLADARAAMDSLAASYGARQFVVGGLCSGALNAHRICLADPRVVAMWMLDGYAYPTRRYYQHLLVRRLRNPASWGLLSRRIYAHARARVVALRGATRGGGGADPAPSAHGDGRQAIFYQDWPPITDARRELEQMLARGVQMLFVYTGGWSSFVDPRQFDEMFPRLGRREQINVTYYPRADHSYLALDDRRAMLRDVGDFVGRLASAP